jgi:hypothetical protein
MATTGMPDGTMHSTLRCFGKVYLVKKSWNNGIMLELFASETVFAFFVK